MKRLKCPDRGIIRITGEDSRNFLQGLISNDIARADGKHALYGALLTPQGKYLFDFFIIDVEGALLLECPAGDVEPLMKKLSMFKLRSKVVLEDVSADFDVHVLFGDGAVATLDADAKQIRRADGSILYADPRLPEAGVRALTGKDFDAAALGGDVADEATYQRHRIRLGLPEAPDDLQKDKSILMESGFDELAGVDWKKGCYMGQELTARTKYRGLVKKRLVPVTLAGATPPASTDLVSDGKLVGELRSINGDLAMAMLRIPAITAGVPIMAGETRVTPAPPAWLQLPDAAGDDEE